MSSHNFLSLPKVSRKDDKIVIEIPEDVLVFALEQSPRAYLKVLDKEAFINEVVDRIFEHCSGTDDEPMFFRLLDEIAEDMAEYGHPSIKTFDPEE